MSQWGCNHDGDIIKNITVNNKNDRNIINILYVT